MKPVLFSFPTPDLLTRIILLLVVALAIGIWLWVVSRREPLTKDHYVTALVTLAVAFVPLALLGLFPTIRINAYGAMLTLGFLAGTFTAMRLGIRRGIPGENIIDLGLIILIGAIIGARLMYVLITKDSSGAHPPIIDRAILQEGMGGLSFHGGFIGGVLAAWIYVLINKINFWRVADTMAPGLAIGYAITRIGCFLNGCCYGRIAPEWFHFPIAVTFPAFMGRVPIVHVYATQLYAMAMGLVMFGILLLLSRGKSMGRAGRLLMVLLMLEGVERFVMEIFREPDPNFTSILSPAQVVSIILVIIGIIGFFLLKKVPAVVEAETVSGE